MPPLSPRSSSPLAASTKSGAAGAMLPPKHQLTDDDVVIGTINSSTKPSNVLLWKDCQRKQLRRLGEALSGPSRASKSKPMMHLLYLCFDCANQTIYSQTLAQFLLYISCTNCNHRRYILSLFLRNPTIRCIKQHSQRATIHTLINTIPSLASIELCYYATFIETLYPSKCK